MKPGEDVSEREADEPSGQNAKALDDTCESNGIHCWLEGSTKLSKAVSLSSLPRMEVDNGKSCVRTLL